MSDTENNPMRVSGGIARSPADTSLEARVAALETRIGVLEAQQAPWQTWAHRYIAEHPPQGYVKAWGAPEPLEPGAPSAKREA